MLLSFFKSITQDLVFKKHYYSLSKKIVLLNRKRTGVLAIPLKSLAKLAAELPSSLDEKSSSSIERLEEVVTGSNCFAVDFPRHCHDLVKVLGFTVMSQIFACPSQKGRVAFLLGTSASHLKTTAYC